MEVQEAGQAAPRDGSARPSIFVCGNSRSGTSMMGHLLGLHPDVFITAELHFFEHLSTEEDRRVPLETEAAIDLTCRLLRHQHGGVVNREPLETFRPDATAFVERFGGRPVLPTELFGEFLGFLAERRDKRIPCEQTPRNVFWLQEILELYPGARAVVMVRDPRDVLASQKHKWKLRRKGYSNLQPSEALRLWVNYHPLTTSMLWKAAIAAGDRFAGHERVYTVRFEDVLVDPEGEIRKLCDWLGIAYDPAMLSVPQVKSTFEKWDASKVGINPDAAGRWKRGALSKAEIYLCQRVARAEMLRHGYELAPGRPGPAVALNLATFPVKAVLAVAANRGRTRSLAEGVRRRFARSSG